MHEHLGLIICQPLRLQVRQLEHEKAVVNTTFEHRVNQLEAQLSTAKSDRESSRGHASNLEMDMSDLGAQVRAQPAQTQSLDTLSTVKPHTHTRQVSGHESAHNVN